MGLEAIISGGGIGGLATAAALAQRGWKVTVFESRPELRVSGSGIYLRDNGLNVLSELGAYDRVMRNPFLGRGVEQRDRLNNLVHPARLPPGRRIVAVPRADLLAGLEQAARDAGVKIVTGKEVVDAKANGTLVFANSDELQADLAIGCDGIWSAVRRGIGVEQSRVRSYEGALRTIVKATQAEMPEEVRGNFIECWNGTRRLLITPINEQEVYLALTCREDDKEARDVSIRPCWRESFPAWSFLLDRINDAVSWGVYTIIHCKTWSAGRTCVLGDSAHATTPNLGQGGGMAMQNGLALAAYMANVTDPRDIPEGLAEWEKAMRPTVETCQHWASLFNEIANVPDEYRPDITKAFLGHPWVLSKLATGAASVPITKTDWVPNVQGARK
ncbi:NAD(P)/FAD-dependent oxidoreductase [Ferrovibrio sp.]|uniref:FAD-dependent oxidoreductase n=1 Tax=Ferrovibrio sp. TaxID=1917215 RepID=UPI00261746C3|nr:NAD(P)/FAD-dependent oxidoreductase [Ferrovibrio sp.]